MTCGWHTEQEPKHVATSEINVVLEGNCVYNLLRDKGINTQISSLTLQLNPSAQRCLTRFLPRILLF
jgi:hypothetical protein